MEFHIGSLCYAVVRKYGLSLDLDPVQGLIDYERQIIYVDGLIEQRETLEDILRHEQAHAWEWHVGKPTGSEQRAQWTATVGQTFDRDYQAGGGAEGFLALPIQGTRPVSAQRRVPDISSAFAQQRSCGMCGQTIASGSVATGEPLATGGESRAVDRWLRCPICDSVTVWRETCHADGTPTGGIVNARVLSPQDAEAWLAEHPAPPCEWNVA